MARIESLVVFLRFRRLTFLKNGVVGEVPAGESFVYFLMRSSTSALLGAGEESFEEYFFISRLILVFR